MRPRRTRRLHLIKGKQVAVSTFGGTSHGSVLILLSQLGLTASDVVITQVGGQTARIAAVKAGSVACAPIDLAQADEMTAAGLVTLTDNKSSGKQWGRSALSVQAAFAQANPNTVKAVVAAVLEAQNSMWLDPATAAAKFADYAQISVDDATKQIAGSPTSATGPWAGRMMRSTSRSRPSRQSTRRWPTST